MMGKNLLIGDIGGTNARFAVANSEHPGYLHEMNLQCADFPGVEQAIRFYLDQLDKGQPDLICLAIAGPVIDQRVQLTNNPWIIDARQLSSGFASCTVKLINDFTAIALSIPLLADQDQLPVGANIPRLAGKQEFSLGIIGPGTGLGISGLLKRHGHIIPVTTEAGHTGFAPDTRLQAALLQVLRERWQRVSNERLVSGAGLENIFWALNRLHGLAETPLSAADIFQQAIMQAGSMADHAVQIFFEVLGQVAGDAALALGAEDGIYIAGGMVMRYPQLLAESRFRNAFENKGRHQELMQRIPSALITHRQPGLLGAAYQATLLHQAATGR